MQVLIVHLRVKPDRLDAFRALAEENAAASAKEAGVLRFEVLRRTDDPERFVLYEAYREAADVERHRETAHYKKWKDTIDDLLAEPRTRELLEPFAGG